MRIIIRHQGMPLLTGLENILGYMKLTGKVPNTKKPPEEFPEALITLINQTEMFSNVQALRAACRQTGFSS